jgi:hypothetical protein
MEITGTHRDGAMEMVTTAGVVRDMMEFFEGVDADNPAAAFKAFCVAAFEIDAPKQF